MTGEDKRVAYAQLERGIRAIDKTLDVLDTMLLRFDTEQHRKAIFESMAELNKRRRMLDSYVAGFGRSEVSVLPPQKFDYMALDQAVRLIEAVTHAPNDIRTGLHLATTISDALHTTWANINHRSSM